jgi:signal transduction histidine kinase
LIILIVYNLYKTIRIDKTKISLFEDSSHELRTPLNAILNYTLFTKEDLEVKEPNLASDLGIVYKSGIDLLYYIDALQSIYKNNRIQQEVNLENLVKEISIKVETNYSNTNNKFSLNIQNSIPLLKKDSFKIEWIVYQFLTNSFKNTNSGQISLNLSKDKNSIHIQVKDNGRGIEEMILNKLNLLFSQNLESLLKKPKGEKLGLYLSALFAKTLNGKIEILSNEKEGSIFTFIFPIE